MSKLGLVIGMATMMAAAAENNYSGKSGLSYNVNPEPAWKRKKCKSCRSCGSYCHLYNHKGHILTRWSKPTYNACSGWSQK
jgi:Pyruvate/2-oxoacid:ferredoxin oxidoreductase delta subunit